ncbi:MAG: hypothetical protein HZA93_29385 [Verrucomicrobia bacterium]|nr:hypothetical protein [Verrucomicrobiota bacterium]
MFGMLLGFLLLPLCLLCAGVCGMVVWAQLVAAWHSGAVPAVLAIAAFGCGLMFVPARKRR